MEKIQDKITRFLTASARPMALPAIVKHCKCTLDEVVDALQVLSLQGAVRSTLPVSSIRHFERIAPAARSGPFAILHN